LVKRLSILGSTGSIGVNALKVVESLPGRFDVVALAAGTNIDLLEQQIQRHAPQIVSVGNADLAAELRRRIAGACEIVHGAEGLVSAATRGGVEMVVAGLVGAVGMRPVWAAIDRGTDVALANKEVLVVAGEPMTRRAGETGAKILPVDSEHNALHQCLRGEADREVRRLWLTASGGPFRRHSAEQLKSVTVDEALRHPTWKMGPKITIDSATLMNKGLEVIEARWLFDVGPERIRVVVHPQSVVHSMVELVDGSFKAQLGVTDMRHPIQYALTWPERCESDLPPFDPVAGGALEFEAPDTKRFPCLDLAFRALGAGGAAPAVLNAANEVAVQAFLDGKIRFLQIPEVIAAALQRHAGDEAADVEALHEVDRRARETAASWLAQGVRS
jgi:1-deoxy-D-xylulose-5-phosphate reductoisomerase